MSIKKQTLLIALSLCLTLGLITPSLYAAEPPKSPGMLSYELFELPAPPRGRWVRDDKGMNKNAAIFRGANLQAHIQYNLHMLGPKMKDVPYKTVVEKYYKSITDSVYQNDLLKFIKGTLRRDSETLGGTKFHILSWTAIAGEKQQAFHNAIYFAVHPERKAIFNLFLLNGEAGILGRVLIDDLRVMLEGFRFLSASP